MGRVLTNNLSLAYSIEASREVLAALPIWKTLEPNKINDWGPKIKTVAREPISKTRQRRKGTIVDLDAAFGYDGDITLDVLRDFTEGFIFANAKGGTILRPASADGAGNYTIPGGAVETYLHAEGLLYARGFAIAGNNGLKTIDTVTAAVAAFGTYTLASNVVDGDTVTIDGVVYTWETGALDAAYKVKVSAVDASGSLDNLIAAINGDAGSGTLYAAGTAAHPTVSAAAGAGDTMIATARVAGSAGNAIATTEVSTHSSWGAGVLASGSDLIINIEETTTAEAGIPDAQNATLELAGYRGVASDLRIDSSGNLTSEVGGIDFTTLGLMAGQTIWIGGVDTANSFATTNDRGFARIVTVAAHKLTLDKKSATFATDTGTGKLIHIYFGQFVRNVAVDDADYLERTYQFEAAFPGLGSADETRYQYAPGNECDQITFNMPLTNKAEITVGFIGVDTEPYTSTRKTNAANAREPVGTSAFNTATDFVRLRVTEVDEEGLTTDFKSIKVTLNNNANPEKVLGRLGARYINVGIFQVDIAATILFTSSDVPDAIRANDTVTMEWALRNDDGGIFVDIPSLTLGDGKQDFPVNQSVTMNLSGIAFKDVTLGTSLGVSLFPYLPAE